MGGQHSKWLHENSLAPRAAIANGGQGSATETWDNYRRGTGYLALPHLRLGLFRQIQSRPRSRPVRLRYWAGRGVSDRHFGGCRALDRQETGYPPQPSSQANPLGLWGTWLVASSTDQGRSGKGEAASTRVGPPISRRASQLPSSLTSAAYWRQADNALSTTSVDVASATISVTS
jgi:hypothetical protein